MSAATPFIKILREYRHKKRLAAVRKWLTERAEGRTKALDPSFCLSDTQRSEVLGFYDGYPTAPLPFVAFYTAATGKFFSNYIPDDLYIQYIDKYFNNWALAEKMDNKTLSASGSAICRSPQRLSTVGTASGLTPQTG